MRSEGTMATATLKTPPSPTWGIARLRRHLGMIPAERILLFPYSGPATPEDVLYLDDHHDLICELIDGVLVRKPMGAEESRIAMFIGAMITTYSHKRKLGVVLGEAGFLEMMPGQVRAPDVSFISKKRLPGGKLPKKAFPAVAPDLAIEVLSESNTPKEMARKREECFARGTQLVWEVDPRTKTVEVFTSPTESKVLGIGRTLDGGDVLPGFKLKISKIFSE
jgi:Uma2 family endonuclease